MEDYRPKQYFTLKTLGFACYVNEAQNQLSL